MNMRLKHLIYIIVPFFFGLLIFSIASIANAQSLNIVGDVATVSGVTETGASDNCVLVYDVFSNPNESQLEGLMRPGISASWATGFTFTSLSGDDEFTIDFTQFYTGKPVLLALMTQLCNNYNPSLTDSRDRQVTNPAYYDNRQSWVYVNSSTNCVNIGSTTECYVPEPETPELDPLPLPINTHYLVGTSTCDYGTSTSTCTYQYLTATSSNHTSVSFDGLLFMFGLLLLLSGINTWYTIINKLS